MVNVSSEWKGSSVLQDAEKLVEFKEQNLNTIKGNFTEYFSYDIN